MSDVESRLPLGEDSIFSDAGTTSIPFVDFDSDCFDSAVDVFRSSVSILVAPSTSLVSTVSTPDTSMAISSSVRTVVSTLPLIETKSVDSSLGSTAAVLSLCAAFFESFLALLPSFPREPWSESWSELGGGLEREELESMLWRLLFRFLGTVFRLELSDDLELRAFGAFVESGLFSSALTSDSSFIRIDFSATSSVDVSG